jgi:hypothetical protein
VPRRRRDTAGYHPRQGPAPAWTRPAPGRGHPQQLYGPDVYLRLVHRLGWTAEDFQRWLEATLAWQLLGAG